MVHASCRSMRAVMSSVMFMVLLVVTDSSADDTFTISRSRPTNSSALSSATQSPELYHMACAGHCSREYSCMQYLFDEGKRGHTCSLPFYLRLQKLFCISISTFVHCSLCLRSAFHMRTMLRQRKSHVGYSSVDRAIA